jgi:5,10-methylenetetrahydromethanopterin reductase
MEYGIALGLSPREPITRFVEIVRRAEDLGFSAAWLTDSQLTMKDAPSALALGAASTERIRMGPGVTNPVTRNITTIANWMAALNEISGGRALLGVGTGDSAVSPLGMRAATRAELRQHIEDFRALTSGGEASFGGQDPVKLLTANTSPPVYISASQMGMLRLAGACADGVILMGAADPEITQWQLDHISEGAREAGRTLDDITVDLWFGISVLDDLEQARNDVRSWVTSQARWMHTWKELPLPLQGYTEEFRHANESYAFAHHLSRHAEHARGVSDSLVDLLAVCGPVQRCLEKIAPLLALKIDRLTFTLLPGGRMERLRVLGEEIVNGLSAQVAAS